MSSKKPLFTLLDAAVARAQPLCVALLVLGVAGFLLLPLAGRETYFDENALLAGSANSGIRASGVLTHVKPWLAAAANVSSHAEAVRLQARHLADLGRQHYTQEFHAAGITDGEGRPLRCSNLHSVVRSARGDGKEAILLVTPLAVDMTTGTGWRQSHGGAALALAVGTALSAYLAEVPWLTKDFIWLVPDARCGLLGSVQAWVREYHEPAGLLADGAHVASFGNVGSFARAGVLQQALVLEAAGGALGALELSVEGWNGQLPKLDIYHLVHFLAADYLRIPTTLQGGATLPGALADLKMPQPVAAHAAALVGAARFAARQASGLPTGAHAAFLHYGIDGITLRLTPPLSSTANEGVAAAAGSLHKLAPLLEHVVRSCNNLAERLHHAPQLYLLTSPGAFVPVGAYIAPLAALLLIPVLQAAAAFRALGQGSAAAVAAAASDAGAATPVRQPPSLLPPLAALLAVKAACAAIAAGGWIYLRATAGTPHGTASGSSPAHGDATDPAGWTDAAVTAALAATVAGSLLAHCLLQRSAPCAEPLQQEAATNPLQRPVRQALIPASAVAGSSAASINGAQHSGRVAQAAPTAWPIALLCLAAEAAALAAVDWAAAFVTLLAAAPACLALGRRAAAVAKQARGAAKSAAAEQGCSAERPASGAAQQGSRAAGEDPGSCESKAASTRALGACTASGSGSTACTLVATVLAASGLLAPPLLLMWLVGGSALRAPLPISAVQAAQTWSQTVSYWAVALVWVPFGMCCACCR